MNYKSFNLGDWIGHISGVIEDETTLDGNEMRDLVEFLSTLKQEPCEDAVSRQTVFDMATTIQTDDCSGNEIMEVVDVDDIKDLPPVTPVVVERKKGKWKYSGSYDVEGMLYCSCCKHEIDVSEGYFKYCPNCGAEMEDEE